jgi:1-aminocyclopropane-1-carboxylate deaminase
LFKDKDSIALQFNDNNAYIISEGGFGILGAKGAGDILSVVDTSNYTHIICACGTGTMLAGIVEIAMPRQQVIGINVLKGYENIKEDVKKILTTNKDFVVLNEYHFGGYAKHPISLTTWMNELWQKENLPTDIVYTAKLLFAVDDLINKNYFDLNSKVLVIHSGGLQGNSSLEKGTLLWDGV